MIANLTAQELVGKTVKSIRVGFGLLQAGQIMKITSFRETECGCFLKLEKTEGSKLSSYEVQNHRGWELEIKKVADSLELIKK